MYIIKMLEISYYIYIKCICICGAKMSRFTILQFTIILFIYVMAIFQDMRCIYTK